MIDIPIGVPHTLPDGRVIVAVDDLETPEPAVGIPIPCETITLDQFNRMKHRRFPHSR